MSKLLKSTKTSVLAGTAPKAYARFRHVISQPNHQATEGLSSSSKSETETKSSGHGAEPAGPEGVDTGNLKRKQTVAEQDAALMATLQDMDGGGGAVEEKEWNGMARNVKENMVSDWRC